MGSPVPARTGQTRKTRKKCCYDADIVPDSLMREIGCFRALKSTEMARRLTGMCSQSMHRRPVRRKSQWCSSTGSRNQSLRSWEDAVKILLRVRRMTVLECEREQVGWEAS